MLSSTGQDIRSGFYMGILENFATLFGHGRDGQAYLSSFSTWDMPTYLRLPPPAILYLPAYYPTLSAA